MTSSTDIPIPDNLDDEARAIYDHAVRAPGKLAARAGKTLRTSTSSRREW